MASKKWDPYRGCFVNAKDYDEEQAAEARAAWASDSIHDPTPEDLLNKELDTRGMRLSGGLTFKGDAARHVIAWLDEHGYRDFRYSYKGSLVKVLPEEKMYGEWVMEAIYWYARECGVPVGEGEPSKISKRRKIT